MKKLIPPLIAALCLLVFAFPAAAYESSCEEELARDTGADKIVSESSDTGGVFDIVVSSVKAHIKTFCAFSARCFAPYSFRRCLRLSLP